MFDWNDLRYFLAVARAGSTLAAAKLLGTSQPTVQRRLVALEEQIGRQLVERRATGYVLTHAGRQLLPFAERIEQDVAALERHLNASVETIGGVLRITCPEADIDRVLSPLLDRFRAMHPDLRLEVIVTDRSLDLAKGEADIALRGGQLQDDALVGRKIADTLWLLYGSRTYLERRGRPQRPEQINDHSVILYAGPIAQLRPLKWLQSVAPNAHVAAYGNSVLGGLSAAKSGAGLVMLPAFVGNAESALDCAFAPQPELTEPMTLVVHPDLRQAARVRAFFDFVEAEAKTVRDLLRGRARQE
jgi:DNA-binding transcriptional LysR family regulator